MRWISLVLLAACAGCLLLARKAMESGEIQTIMAGSDTRRYLVHVPQSYRKGTPVPLVLVLHGGGGNGRGAEHMSGFTAKAEKEGFIVVYPYGWGRFEERLLTWNAGNCCGLALKEQKDDVGFLRQLVSRLKSDYAIDEKRVFAAGMSNGAMMAYKLACEAPDVFSAVASVAGALNTPCAPAQPVGLIIVHGRADRHVLYQGGGSEKTADSYPRVDASVSFAAEFFKRLNSCTPGPVERHGKVETQTFACRDAGLQVHSLDDEGHTWPGGEKGYFAADPPSREFNATDAIWAFFKNTARKPVRAQVNRP